MMSDMSDQPPAAPCATGSLPDGAGDAVGCQKRLHGENGSVAATSSNSSGGAAEQQQEEEVQASPVELSGEPEPPQKRVKVDPDSELDIRFLICGKVSGLMCGRG